MTTMHPGTGLDPAPVELRDYYLVLRARWYYVVGAALVGLVLALVYAAATDATYEATTTVLLRSLSPDPLQQLDGDGSIDTTTERQVAQSLAIAQATLEDLEDAGGDARDLHLPERRPATALLSNLSVSAADDANVMRFTYEDGDPEVAAQRANAFASAYLAYRNNRARDAVSSVRENLESRLASILVERAEVEDRLAELSADADADGVPDGNPVELRAAQAQSAVLDTRQALTQSELQELSTTRIDGGSVISPALTPETPAGLDPLVLAVAGLIGGAIAGMVIAFLRNSLDQRLAVGDDVANVLGAPSLGYLKDTRPHRRLRLSPDRIEGPLRRTAVTLDTVIGDERPRIIVLLSMGDEAAELVAPGLADGLAARQSVIVVGSARSPTSTDLETVFAQVSRQQGTKRRPEWVTANPPGMADRADLSRASDPHMGSVAAVGQVVNHYDLVVVAVESLDVSTAALDLAAIPGTVVVPVVRLGRSRRDELRQVRRDLMTADAEVVGSLVIGPRRSWGTPEALADPQDRPRTARLNPTA